MGSIKNQKLNVLLYKILLFVKKKIRKKLEINFSNDFGKIHL